MKVLRKIIGKTKIDKIRSQQIRESCGIQPINEWMKRRSEWDAHVTRMMLSDYLKYQEKIYLREDLQNVRKDVAT